MGGLIAHGNILRFIEIFTVLILFVGKLAQSSLLKLHKSDLLP